MSRSLLHSDKGKVLPKVRYVIGVAAGKGGVGKSSTTVAMAQALQEEGYAVGVLDADIYGPSMGVMLPLDKEVAQEGEEIIPGESFGIKVFSLAYSQERRPLIARAPVANGLILQCLRDVRFGELDYLFIDFPPGTGDVQITLMQEALFSGAVIVTTPQKVATEDVLKCGKMFEKMEVPVLGVLENMAYFQDPKSGEKHYPFGVGGGKEVAKTLGAPLLGQVPIDSAVTMCSDIGKSLLKESPSSVATKAYKEATKQVKEELFSRECLEGKYLKSFEIIWEK